MALSKLSEVLLTVLAVPYHRNVENFRVSICGMKPTSIIHNYARLEELPLTLNRSIDSWGKNEQLVPPATKNVPRKKI